MEILHPWLRIKPSVSGSFLLQIDSNLNPSTEVDPALALLRGSVNDLKKFKVLGTIDNVILVLDKSTEETFVIKVSRHSCMDGYLYSCLHPLSNERKSMFKSGDS